MAQELEKSTSKALLSAFEKTPFTHPNIPNVAFAGAGFGDPLPSPKVVANVKTEGAKGDGKTDDIDAFVKAIEKAKSAGGGAVLVPAGEYKLSKVLWINGDGVVLRGENPLKSILLFDQPVSKMVPGVSGAWFGGAIWIGPNQPAPEVDVSMPDETIRVTAPAKVGDFSVQVDPADAAKLKAVVGKMTQMTWVGDMSLVKHIAGHPSMDAYNWNSWSALSSGKLNWYWANEIVSVDGAKVTFKKPLRLDIQPDWEVTIATQSTFLIGAGAENLMIRYPVTKKAAHLKEPGYNGVLFERTAHCFARNIVMENVDVGINFSDNAVNCTASGFNIRGRENHHATAMRNFSHDNLLEHFKIESKPHHGLNTEGVSSGNVWRDGEMLNGTFDSHCMMSFDSVRTNIKLNNTGGPGGAGHHGPFVGRRMTHWNITVTNNKGEWVAQPAIMPSGAIVGIRGTELEMKATKLWHLPDGLDKGCVIADIGSAPVVPDLYEAQRKIMKLSPASK